MVVGNGRYDSSTAALKALHWLPIRSRIEFKVCTLVFRLLQGTAPSYLSDILMPAKQPRPRLRFKRKENITYTSSSQHERLLPIELSVCSGRQSGTVCQTI